VRKQNVVLGVFARNINAHKWIWLVMVFFEMQKECQLLWILANIAVQAASQYWHHTESSLGKQRVGLRHTNITPPEKRKLTTGGEKHLTFPGWQNVCMSARPVRPLLIFSWWMWGFGSLHTQGVVAIVKYTQKRMENWGWSGRYAILPQDSEFC
jgi:hypothetical protein